MQRTFLATLALSLAIPLSPARAASPLDDVRPFLKAHCYQCHGETKQKNDKRFDTLATELSKVETLETWQEILDQLNLGEMPPAKEPRPDPKATAKVIEILSAQLREAYAARRSTGAQTVVRRLNRYELRNTVRDLLYINDPELRIGNVARLVDNNGNGQVENTSTDPFRAFPADEEEHGFDNIGDRLVMSAFFLQLMLDAAEESIAMATETGPRPKVTTRKFAGHIQKQGKAELERFARQQYPDFDALYTGNTLTPDELRSGVGTSTRYRITIEVSGHNQKHPWAELIPTDQSEPFLLNLRLFKNRTRDDHIPLARFELSGDGTRQRFTHEVWIDKSWMPQLTWDNGPSDRELRTDLLMQKYLPTAFKPAPDRKVIPKEDYEKARADWSREMALALLENYQGPSVRVHSMTLEPVIEQWPPRSHTALYGDKPGAKVDVESLLLKFAQRAFRRPVSAEEVQPFVALVRSQLPGAKAEEPAADGIQNLTFKSYRGQWSKLPEFAKLKPFDKGKLASGQITLAASNAEEHFGLVFEGTLATAKAGEYEFQLASDDGSRLIIDGKSIIEHDGLHGASTKKGKAQLAAGDHAIRIEYFAFGKPNSLRASWSGPGFEDRPLSAPDTAPPQRPDLNADAMQTIKALQAGYTAILCSPDFLYMKEQPGRLSDHAIASRLSYFLWSSMPDDELFALAASGKLTDEKILRGQVDRMLDDPKAAAFTRHFTERWLRLDKLAISPPELNGPFRVYWDRRLEPQIVDQTVTYFGDLVKRNGPIRELIDSDYTFLNESIATVFYGRNDVKGETLRKVPTNDPRRGGIFTQPSVMTATANGVDTSPVVRGVWVLENILGTPPSPPPPDVEPLAPDLRGTKTIREQIALHRQQESCSGCHSKIDPMGFAFENFDPIGRWRETYPENRKKIDASATLSNGQELADIVAFKKFLLARQQQITRCLCEKLLTYASGRVLEPVDRGEVDRVLSRFDAERNGVRDLIHLIVQSDVFLSK